MFRFHLSILGLALLSVPLAAAPADSQGSAGPERAVKPRKICRAATTTGSIMRARVCKTKAEWDVIDAQTAETTRRELDYRSRSGGAGNN